MSIAETQDLVVLHCVAKHASYAKAADELGLSPSRVSRIVSGLEERLEVRLVQRTTRKLSLTEAGRSFCSQTRSIVSELEEAETEIGKHDLAPRGKLRISLPTVFGKIFAVELLGAVAARFPDLKLELSLVDRYVDLVEEAVDLAIRVGPVNDENLSARSLCTNRRLLVAAPAYLERNGHPSSLLELQSHTCILFSGFKPATEWKLVGPEGPRVARVSGNVRSNNMHVVATCAMEGLGIAPGATMSVAQALVDGALVRVLPEYEFQPTSIYAVYPSSRQLSTKVRPVVDFLAHELGDPPTWDRLLADGMTGSLEIEGSGGG